MGSTKPSTDGEGEAKTSRRRRSLPRSPLALSILNLLAERSMHPYEMRSLMRGRGHERAFRIRESSIYDTVQRLVERGLAEPVEVSRQGRWPERTVYAITELGRAELHSWMEELVSTPAPEYPEFAAPLMFLVALGREPAIEALEGRAARLEGEIQRSEVFRRSYLKRLPDFPRIFGVEEEYAQAMRRAELEWVRRLAAELRDGSLPWPELPPAEGAGS